MPMRARPVRAWSAPMVPMCCPPWSTVHGEASFRGEACFRRQIHIAFTCTLCRVVLLGQHLPMRMPMRA